VPEVLSAVGLALVVAAAGVAGFVTGLAGFGTGLVAAGLWLHLLPASFVPPLVAIGSVAAQIASWSAVHRTVRWRALLPYLIGAVVGVPFGVLVMGHAASFLLRPVVGVFLVAFAVSELSGLSRFRIGTFGGRAADGLVGAAGGFLGGFAGLSAPLPVIWLRLRGGPLSSQRAVYQPFSFLALSAATLVMGMNGHLHREILVVTGFCLPALLLGALLGVRCYGKVNQAVVQRVVLGVLLLSGLTLLR